MIKGKNLGEKLSYRKVDLWIEYNDEVCHVIGLFYDRVEIEGGKTTWFYSDTSFYETKDELEKVIARREKDRKRKEDNDEKRKELVAHALDEKMCKIEDIIKFIEKRYPTSSARKKLLSHFKNEIKAVNDEYRLAFNVLRNGYLDYTDEIRGCKHGRIFLKDIQRVEFIQGNGRPALGYTGRKKDEPLSVKLYVGDKDVFCSSCQYFIKALGVIYGNFGRKDYWNEEIVMRNEMNLVIEEK